MANMDKHACNNSFSHDITCLTSFTLQQWKTYWYIAERMNKKETKKRNKEKTKTNKQEKKQRKKK